MTIDLLREYCLSLPYVTEDIKWGSVLCFSVAGRIFFVVSLDETPLGASFKVRDEDFDFMCGLAGFVQAPYFAKNKWVKVLDIDTISSTEWKEYLLQSYQLIKLKLTKKLQKEIDEKLSLKKKDE